MSTTQPLQNRVAPDGEVVAHPARGLMMGNRGGRFHQPDRTLGRRRWASKAWIACRLAFKSRHRAVMGDSYTELFFLDEATALAAGHRPCFECRRGDALAFGKAWERAFGFPKRPMVKEIDAVLHKERLGPRGVARLQDLPEGTIIRNEGGPALIWGGALRPWSFEGYGSPERLDPSAAAEILTPACVRAVFSAGYRPMVHPSCAG